MSRGESSQMSASCVSAGETDEAYVQGLRDAEALLEEGCLTGEEAEREKGLLAKQRSERRAAGPAAEEQVGVGGRARSTKRKLCEHGRRHAKVRRAFRIKCECVHDWRHSTYMFQYLFWCNMCAGRCPTGYMDAVYIHIPSKRVTER